MKTNRFVFTRVFFLILSATVFVLFLLVTSLHQNRPVPSATPTAPGASAQKARAGLERPKVRGEALGPVPGEVQAQDSEARFFGALLGPSHPYLDVPTRRVVCQAFLSLNNASKVVDKVAATTSPTSSLLTVLRGYGAALFRSDYSYACRLCPELDPELAEVVYTNALAALEVNEHLCIASNLLEQTSQAAGLKRPPAPMEDHYAQAFESTFPSEETMAYSNLLVTVRHSVGYEPLSTDLFNDALVYVMSMTELRQEREETLRTRAKIAHWEQRGQEPSLDKDPEDPSWADSLESHSDPGLDQDFVTQSNAFREIFGYRFAECHGLAKDEFLSVLDKQSVPPTALWVHIKPKRQ